MIKLDKGDYTLTTIYVIVNIGALLIFYFDILEKSFFNKYFFIVGLVFFFLIFTVFYKRFRKKRMLIIWGILGLIQLIAYYYYRDYPELQTMRGSSLRWLKAMPATIAVFYLFNLINRKLYGDYFIVTVMRIAGRHVDIDERELRPMDSMFSFIGFMIILLVVIL